MAKAYWIASVTITDPETFKTYQGMVEKALEQHGGRYIVRGGTSETVEGIVRDRQVIVEFDNYEQALICYRSPEYAAAIKVRQQSAETNLVIVEGIEGPDPARL